MTKSELLLEVYHKTLSRYGFMPIEIRSIVGEVLNVVVNGSIVFTGLIKDYLKCWKLPLALISKPVDIDPNRISGWLTYIDNKRFEFHNGTTSVLFNLDEVKQLKGSRVVLSH